MHENKIQKINLKNTKILSNGIQDVKKYTILSNKNLEHQNEDLGTNAIFVD